MNIETVVYIAKKLNEKNAVWGIGGSFLLYQHGIIDVVNDLDIIVHSHDADNVANILRDIGQEQKVEPLPPYRTTYYHEFTIKDLSMDVMGEFKIEHEEGCYIFKFDKTSIEYHMINGVKIPFCTLEDWYVLYQLIPGREEKVQRIESFLAKQQVNNPAALMHAVEKSALPAHVKLRIENLLNNTSTDIE